MLAVYARSMYDEQLYTSGCVWPPARTLFTPSHRGSDAICKIVSVKV